MAKRDKMMELITPLLEPGEQASHAFRASYGAMRPSPNKMILIAVTDRNVVTAPLNHFTKWKLEGEIERLPRQPFPDLPSGGVIGFKRWTWNGLGLWLDAPSRKVAAEANAAMGAG